MKKSYWGPKGEPGKQQAQDSSTAHVEDLMISRVVALTRHQSVGRLSEREPNQR